MLHDSVLAVGLSLRMISATRLNVSLKPSGSLPPYQGKWRLVSQPMRTMVFRAPLAARLRANWV